MKSKTKRWSWVKRKTLTFVLVVQWGLARVDDMDTAHADEPRFLMRSWLQLRDLKPILKHKKRFWITIAFWAPKKAYLVDSFVELGKIAEKEHLKKMDVSRSEILILVSGFKDFAQFSKIKSQILAMLKEES
jgi:hypothetical protein